MIKEQQATSDFFVSLKTRFPKRDLLKWRGYIKKTKEEVIFFVKNDTPVIEIRDSKDETKSNIIDTFDILKENTNLILKKYEVYDWEETEVKPKEVSHLKILKQSA